MMIDIGVDTRAPRIGTMIDMAGRGATRESGIGRTIVTTEGGGQGLEIAVTHLCALRIEGRDGRPRQTGDTGLGDRLRHTAQGGLHLLDDPDGPHLHVGNGLQVLDAPSGLQVLDILRLAGGRLHLFQSLCLRSPCLLLCLIQSHHRRLPNPVHHLRQLQNHHHPPLQALPRLLHPAHLAPSHRHKGHHELLRQRVSRASPYLPVPKLDLQQVRKRTQHRPLRHLRLGNLHRVHSAGPVSATGC